uniref:hypothetical protein n=1 Tax=Clostridium sp. NkU-1 TaxID=1095009 RepID=UPI0006CFAC54
MDVTFIATESILHHDWWLMGQTSLLMFSIYGCGALLGPIGNLIDWRVNSGSGSWQRKRN